MSETSFPSGYREAASDARCLTHISGNRLLEALYKTNSCPKAMSATPRASRN